jgi:hypothetical protein
VVQRSVLLADEVVRKWVKVEETGLPKWQFLVAVCGNRSIEIQSIRLVSRLLLPQMQVLPHLDSIHECLGILLDMPFFSKCRERMYLVEEVLNTVAEAQI